MMDNVKPQAGPVDLHAEYEAMLDERGGRLPKATHRHEYSPTPSRRAMVCQCGDSFLTGKAAKR